MAAFAAVGAVAVLAGCDNVAVVPDEQEPDVTLPDVADDGTCTPAGSCAELGWGCGLAPDGCGGLLDCAAEGRSCNATQACIGGVSGPAVCVAPDDCPLCDAVPDCADAEQPTRLTGRVVTAGRADDHTEGQVGVPGAHVSILRTADPDALPLLASGLPEDADEQRCRTCPASELGPVLVDTSADAAGYFVLEELVPVGEPFLLVVRSGRFRRATVQTIPAASACTTVELPVLVEDGNPTRLPRDLDDGLAAHIPRFAVATGEYDASECLLDVIGIDRELFGHPSDDSARVHLYRDNGAWSPAARACQQCASTTSAAARSCRELNCGGPEISDRTAFIAAQAHDVLFGTGARAPEYDAVIVGCRGDLSGAPGTASRGRLRRYLNRGGQITAMHFADSWITNGDSSYDPEAPLATGTNAAVSYATPRAGNFDGIGRIDATRPQASPHINRFLTWALAAGVVSDPDDPTFPISEPRSRAVTLGPHTHEYVHCEEGNCTATPSPDMRRPHLVAFDTPYGAPVDAACGRAIYVGYHTVGGSASSVFPQHCVGALAEEDRSLLYPLLDAPPCAAAPLEPPVCSPSTRCTPGICTPQPDGCGNVIPCDPC